jgi:uncharacterized protein YggE
MLDNFRGFFALAAPAMVGAALMVAPLGAQGTPVTTQTPAEPQISTTARGEVQVTPDRATVTIAVETRGQTAAAAAAANAERQQAVLSALKGAGIAAAQIKTVGFNVFPEYSYDNQGRTPPKITGYRASNSVMVEVRQIDQVGKILDTALGAGANNISGVQFYASTADAARREALAKAVEKARADADVLARAAGGTVGRLIEVGTAEYQMPIPRPYDMAMARGVAAQAAPTPIEPGEYTISATVGVRWQFIPNR